MSQYPPEQPGAGGQEPVPPQQGQQPTPPPHQPTPPPQAGAANPRADDAKSLLAALFDFRFHTLVTPKIVKIVYAVGVALIALFWFLTLVRAFAADQPIFGVAVLLIGPVIALVYIAFLRMTLELYFAVVRMSDDIHRTYNPHG